MTDFRERYKRIGYGRENADMNRELRSQKRNEARHEMRNKQFSLRRDLEIDDHQELIHSPEQDQNKHNQNQIHDKTAAAIEGSQMRLRQLEQWREKRNIQKIQEKRKVKPIFKVGVVHHRVYSPPLSKTQVQPPATVRLCKTKEINSEPKNKKVSKATEKRIALKTLTNKQKRENLRSKNEKKNEQTIDVSDKNKFNFTIKQENCTNVIKGTRSPKFALDKSKDICDNQSVNCTEVQFDSAIKKNNPTEVTKQKNIPKIILDKSEVISGKESLVIENLSLHESSSNDNLPLLESSNHLNELKLIKKEILDESANSIKDLDKPPILFSPYVVTSRGKSSARKEIQRRRSCQNTDEIPTKDTVMQNLNISVADEERTAQYYKYILNKEIDSLNELCTMWNAVKENELTPENIFYEIQAAVGQTQLLINKKFERFRGLVLDCETGKGEMLVTCKDLQGFWEMMYMEVEDCNNRFNKLEEKKLRNWEDLNEPIKNEVVELRKKKPLAIQKRGMKKKPGVAKSSLRAHIMAARKKMVEDNAEVNINLDSSRETNVNRSVSEEKKNTLTPNKNKRRTSTPKSVNNWKAMLKKVQLSQTKNPSTSPLVVMKLSQMCKTPEIQLNNSISYVNSDRTPAKSILKTTKHELISSDSFKSLNKVFFKEESTEFLTLEQDSDNNAVNNTSILDSIDVHRKPAERKLNFESDSFSLSFKEDDEKNVNDVTNVTKPQILLSPLKSRGKKIPKIEIDSPSPINLKSSFSSEDTKITNHADRKHSTNPKRQISFKFSDEDYLSPVQSSKRKKFSVPLTPRLMRKENPIGDDESLNSELAANILKRSEELHKDVTSIQENLDITVDKPNTPKLRKRGSKITNDTSSIELNSTVQASTKPKLRRTKSLNTANDNANNSIQDSPRVSSTKKLRRTKSLKITKEISDEQTKQVVTPNLRARRSKRVQHENVAPNEQEICDKVDEKVKLSRTPSLRKKDLKEQHFNIDQSHQADFTKTNEAVTPSNRRKSLRLAHVNIKEN